MPLTKQRIRLKFILGSYGNINDVLTAALAKFWKGNDVQIEVGLFTDASTPADLTGFEFIALEIRPFARPASGVYVAKSAAPASATITLANWDAGTAQHHTFTLTAAETALDLENNKSQSFWLVVGVTDTGLIIRTAGGTEITVVEDGWGEPSSPLALLQTSGNWTVPVDQVETTVTITSLTTDGYVVVQKTSDGPNVDKLTYAAGALTIRLVGVAPAGGVSGKYLAVKL